ncbi:hypothetical protein [Marinobacter sp. BGYM27]|uniref:hypothetical protein n=1 Tax=unclassified Marinobacter TaxID=83889 RepID=UPI0021A421AD|nr:hypothetical protein [Marinobacter sp. BGYM27]MDG5501471.1 hypothetical protein [Marinobacter sp. BGYM27]
MVPHYIKVAPLALCIAASSVSAQETDAERIDKLEQRVNSLQQQATSSAADRVRLNGFFSTGYARADNDAGFADITEESEVADLSLMALQGTFSINDDTKAVMQLVSRGVQDWDTELEWAYLSHQLTNDLQIRAGKMRLPFFMYSDSLEVGYAQPWARPPQAVYGPVTVNNYVGADATYTYSLGGSAITTQLFSGFTDDPETTSGADVEFRNTVGLNAEWTDYVWKARAVVATAETNISAPGLGQLADGDRGNFYGLGFGYDDGTWQVISEITRIDVDGAFTDTDSAYLTVARRINSLTPYVSVGWIESKDDDERSGLRTALNTNRDEYSLGMRWDVLSGVAVKFDWTYVTGFENDPGGLNAAGIIGDDLDSTNVYTVKIDSAF